MPPPTRCEECREGRGHATAHQVCVECREGRGHATAHQALLCTETAAFDAIMYPPPPHAPSGVLISYNLPLPLPPTPLPFDSLTPSP